MVLFFCKMNVKIEAQSQAEKLREVAHFLIQAARNKETVVGYSELAECEKEEAFKLNALAGYVETCVA
jgi:quinol monooxygenase YgiN